MSTDKSLSQNVGDATNGAVGNETIVHKVQELASHTIEYGKGLVAKDQSTSQTLGGLVNETRDLAGSVLHAASDVIKTGADKAQDAASDAQKSADKEKPVGYVAQARDLAASALSTAESYIATGQKKVEEQTGTSGQEAKEKAEGALNDLTSRAADTKDDVLQGAREVNNETSAQTGSTIDKHLKQ